MPTAMRYVWFAICFFALGHLVTIEFPNLALGRILIFVEAGLFIMGLIWFLSEDA